MMAAPPSNVLTLLTVGRLSPIKHVDVLINAVGILKERRVPAELTIVGGAAGKEGEAYESALRARVRELDLTESVHFSGPVPHDQLSSYFAKANLFLHASETGSLDKASLEPLASGVPIVTVDDELAAANIPAIILTKGNPEAFADAIQTAAEKHIWAELSVRHQARAYVEKNHELSALITRILAEPLFRVKQ